jgi:hypothetical protein
MLSIASILKQDYKNIELCMPKDSLIWDILKTKIKNIRDVSTDPVVASESATGKYLLFLDGAELISPTTLSRWVMSAEALGAKKSRHLALSGIAISTLNHPKNQGWYVPVPAMSERVLMGHCLCSIFALWNRKNFLQVAKNTPIELSHDLALRPFIAQASADNYVFDTFPEQVVRSQFPDYFFQWDSQSQTNILQPYIEKYSQMASIFYALLSSSSDLDFYRDAYYSKKEKTQP